MKFTASLKPCIIFDLIAANAFDQEHYICQSQALRTGGPFAKKYRHHKVITKSQIPVFQFDFPDSWPRRRWLS